MGALRLPAPESPLAFLLRSLSDGSLTPVDVARRHAVQVNRNALHNTYLHFDAADLVAQAESLPERFPSTRPALYGVPVSLKDCFDVRATVTTCGSKFYGRHHPPASEDSAVAARLREAGCLMVGKTHLHQLAYGITGQNRDFGDCLQPRDGSRLTGGSSSGAAASVQEGSALAAIGTDTGGSIRVPAALCGLVGFRCSHSLTHDWPTLWRGAAHLAPSFDTIGLLFADPRDAGLLVGTLFGTPSLRAPTGYRIGCVPEDFLHDCEPAVLATYRAWLAALRRAGAEVGIIDVDGWDDTVEIFAGIQAHEAAALHRGNFDHFEPAIAQRLAWGESLSAAEVDGLRSRHDRFRERLADSFAQFDLLMLPSAPVDRLLPIADQSAVRQAILRYTTPFSLGGLPVAALPGKMVGAGFGTGVQIAAAAGEDAALLAFVEWANEGVADGYANLP
jgi:aspartyl-tRNA(Asn)/glutamyl-tRNA(Gln) amidotransferase subunit A